MDSNIVCVYTAECVDVKLQMLPVSVYCMVGDVHFLLRMPLTGHSSPLTYTMNFWRLDIRRKTNVSLNEKNEN